METNVLRKNEVLCNQLEMDFNEANELFGKETLSGMQMVQVNGGWIQIAKGVYTVLKYVGAALGVTAGVIRLYESLSSSSGPTGSVKITIDESNRYLIIDLNGCASASADSIVRGVDGSINVYNPQINTGSCGTQ